MAGAGRAGRSGRGGGAGRAFVAGLAIGLAATVVACSASGAPQSTEPPPLPSTASPPAASPGTDGTAPPSTATSATPSTSPTPFPPIDPSAFAGVDAAMQRRVSSARVGGYLLVARDGQVLFEKSYGGVGPNTQMAVASTAKWMTATTVMTFVDQGALTLDEPISRWLPQFSGDKASITMRQLLDHTSGVKQQSCIFDLSAVLSECVDRLAAGPLEFAPGSAFSYGNASYHVAARVLEVISGKDFQTLFTERVATPLGLTGTRWAPGTTRNPSPAASARTTAADELRFLTMMMQGGTANGTRVLTPESVAELQRNQVAAYDTSHDYSVGITRIPRYGLGTWVDVVDPDGATVVVSGNGALGFYPWLDHRNRAIGVLAVEDQRGAEVAVPASKQVVDQAIAVLDAHR